MGSPPITGASVRFADFELDLRSGELRRDGKAVNLPPQPARILALLVSRAGQTVSRREIAQQVWGTETFVDFDQGLNFAIRQIRAALADDADHPQYIETVPKRGYRFIGEVSSHTERAQVVSTGSPTNTGWTWLRLAGVMIFASAILAMWLWLGPPRQAVHSIAVLPFPVAGEGASSSDLGDGVTESLIDSLSQLPDLRVMSRASAFRFRQQDLDPQQAGRTLKVDAVLTGRVWKAGDNIQVSTELVRTADGSHVWGKRYSGQMANLLTLQQEMAGDVSQRLQPQLSREQKQRLSKLPTDNVEAYQLFVKGRFFLDRWSHEGRTQATQYFQRAIAKDPGFAAAHAALAEAYFLRVYFSESGDPDEWGKGITEARKAVSLNNTVAEAHASLGLALMMDLHWRDAEVEMKQSTALNPNCAICHIYYAADLMFVGRSPEAISEIEQAVTIDPLSFIAQEIAGEVFYFARDYAKAIRQYQKAIEMDPSNPTSYQDMFDAYLEKQECSEAFNSYARFEDLSGRPQNAALLSRTFVASGCRATLQKLMQFYSDPANGDYYPMSAAVTAAFLGEKDRAFEFMEKAYQTRQGIVWLKAEPQLDNIRSDPRYFVLLRRAGLAP